MPYWYIYHNLFFYSYYPVQIYPGTVLLTYFMFVQEHHLDLYLKSQSQKPDQCWKSSKDGFNWNTSCWYVQPKHVTAFVELVLKDTEKLDKMVLLLDKRYLESYIEDLTATLLHNNDVTIGPLPPTSQQGVEVLSLPLASAQYLHGYDFC